MSIKSRLLNSKQSTFIGIAVLFSVIITSAIITLAWTQKNNELKSVLVGYSDEVAFNLCVNQADEANSMNDYSQLIAKIKCEKKLGIWKQVKREPPKFTSFILKDIDQLLLVVAILTAGIYVLLASCYFFFKCTNLGWKRLAISVSFIPGLAAGYYMFDEAGYNVKGEEYFQILASSATGYILGVFIILGGKHLVVWIKEGFKES